MSTAVTTSPAVFNLSAALVRVRSSRAAALEAIASGLLESSVHVMQVASSNAKSADEMLVADAIGEHVLRIIAHCSIVVMPLAALATTSRPLPSETAFLVMATMNALREVAPMCREIATRYAREPWQAVRCAARDAECAKEELLKHVSVGSTTRWDSFAYSSKRSPFTSSVNATGGPLLAATVNAAAPTMLRTEKLSKPKPVAAAVRIAPPRVRAGQDNPLARLRKLLDEQTSRIESRSDAHAAHTRQVRTNGDDRYVYVRTSHPPFPLLSGHSLSSSSVARPFGERRSSHLGRLLPQRQPRWRREESTRLLCTSILRIPA